MIFTAVSTKLNKLWGRWPFKWVYDMMCIELCIFITFHFSKHHNVKSLPNSSGKEGAMLTLSGWLLTTPTKCSSHSALFQVAANARLLNFNPGKEVSLGKKSMSKLVLVVCWGWLSSEISFSSLSAPSLGVVMQVFV